MKYPIVWFIAWSLCWCAALASAQESPLTFGVLAFSPKAQEIERWRPLAAHLETALGRRIELTAYGFEELDVAVNRNALDVVLTNPGHFFLLQNHRGLSAPLATLVLREADQRLSAFGGTIFVLAKRTDIRTLADLADKRIAAVGERSLGGYQMQALEMSLAGVPLPQGERLLTTGMPHDLAVQAVLDGRADAGFARSGVLERMARDGLLDLADIRVLHRQNLPSYPYISSTRLYPEWPVGVMPQIDEDLARRLTIALLALPPGLIAGIDGFTIPADYGGVETMLRELRLPPFDAPPAFKIGDVWRRYRYPLMALAVAGSAVLLLATALLANNRRLAAARREARKSALRYRFLLDTATDGIHILDKRGRLIEASQSFYKMLDYPRDSVLRVMDWDMRWSEAELLDKIEELFRHPAVFETRHRRRDGGIVDVEINAHGIEMDGETFIYASARDIGERKRAQAELEKYRHRLEDLVRQRTEELSASEAKAKLIIESSADGLYGLDIEGKAIFVNPAACRMLGHSAERIIGHSAHAVFHHSHADGTPYPEAECPNFICLKTGQNVRIDHEVFWHSDGHPVPVMYANYPLIQNGEIVGAVVSFVDLTERRAAELAQEQALIAAEHLASVRKQFLANMSREIRTPLNGILGFAQIGLRQAEDRDKARNAFAKILESGELLLGIVNDILDFSKLEREGFALESIPVDLVDILREASGLVRDKAIAKSLSFKIRKDPDLPQRCLSDPLRLKQILVNLLSNAVKFTETGSVALSVSRRGDWLAFEVSDTGIGMDETQMNRLFEAFEQADGSTTRKFGGTGLGLAIVRRLVDLMDGYIQVRSAPGAGSAFEVFLPYRPAEAQRRDSLAESPEDRTENDVPLRGYSILVAEDNEINRCAIEECLLNFGASVETVKDGAEAVERVRILGADAYDLILMDIQMPGMDGYEATRQIAAFAPDLPVVGQTAHAFGEEKERCFAVGMVGHIAKPIDPRQLVAMVKRHAKSGLDLARRD